MLLLALVLRRQRRVIIPDLYDFDYSFSWTPRRDADVDDHVEQVAAIVRWCVVHGAPSVDLCGHSHGGHITARAAMSVKEFVGKVCPDSLLQPHWLTGMFPGR